jgi:hypothetical protein
MVPLFKMCSRSAVPVPFSSFQRWLGSASVLIFSVERAPLEVT